MNRSSLAQKPNAVAPVYDIVNCGPRSRFVANGKLVSNCNWQNFSKVREDAQGKVVPGTGEIRKSIIAPPGHVLIVGDLAQIEARIVAWLAGEALLVDGFREGRDIYCEFGSWLYRRPITKKDVLERFISKGVVLGCFAADTLVLTDSGWKTIVRVKATDRVWDGEEWVHHGGVVDRGVKEVEMAYGVAATADHEILTEHGWVAWHAVHTNHSLFRSAIARAGSRWLTGKPTPVPQGVLPVGNPLCGAIAGGRDLSTGTISKPVAHVNATLAQRLRRTLSDIGFTGARCLMTGTGNDCSTDSPLPSPAATLRTTPITSTTAHGGSSSMKCGDGIGRRFFGTFRNFLVGMTRKNRLTASTIIADTCRAISGSPPNPSRYGIGVQPATCKKQLNVFDVSCAGPRSRYTIWSKEGSLVVHNSGYGMGWKKFKDTVRAKGRVEISESLARSAIDTYRERYPRIPELWTRMEHLLGNPGTQLGPIKSHGDKIELPDGNFLHYHELRKGESGWSCKTRRGRRSIWGGYVTENVCQALARILIADDILALEQMGQTVATMSHDELVSVVPTEDAERAQLQMKIEMRNGPYWASGLPLDCEVHAARVYGEVK